jgi:hypothetical protein
VRLFLRENVQEVALYLPVDGTDFVVLRYHTMKTGRAVQVQVLEFVEFGNILNE